jgi:hypothetical protein
VAPASQERPRPETGAPASQDRLRRHWRGHDTWPGVAARSTHGRRRPPRRPDH